MSSAPSPDGTPSPPPTSTADPPSTPLTPPSLPPSTAAPPLPPPSTAVPPSAPLTPPLPPPSTAVPPSTPLTPPTPPPSTAVPPSTPLTPPLVLPPPPSTAVPPTAPSTPPPVLPPPPSTAVPPTAPSTPPPVLPPPPSTTIPPTTPSTPPPVLPPPPSTAVSPTTPLTSPPPPPSTAIPPTTTPLTSPPPPPSTAIPPTTTPLTPPPPSTFPPPPSTDLTPSSPPPSSPLTPSPPPPSNDSTSPPSPPPPFPATPSTPPRSSPSPPSPSTPTPPRSVTPSPPPPASPSGGGSPRTPSITPSLSPSPPSSSSGGLSTGVVVGIVIGGVGVLLVMILIFFFCKKKRRRDDEAPPGPNAGGYYGGQQQRNASQPSDHAVTSLPPSAPPRPPAVMSSGSSGGGYDSNYSDHPVLPPPTPGLALGIYQGNFTYEELARATNGFSEANWLGQGGFGHVYRGILRSGKDIAVKQLKAGSAQGEREFQAEVGIISRVHHKHLVALVGYCIDDAQRLLVYEFVPNNTLEFHLHGKGRPPMEWSSRLKIAIGSAKGLSYLHENCNPKIIHRDIKAANILIDFKFEAKVADFGLAKIALDTNTHVSTRVMGTFGYLAPEYAASGKLTEKSDVFSFGVVLLELITGRRPIDANNVIDADHSLVDWARPLLTRALEENNFEGLVDRKLNNEYDIEEMARMVACAATCVRHSARRRPRMDQIARVLEGNISPSDLNQGIIPGESNVYSSYGGSTDYDTSQENEGMDKYRKRRRGTDQENGASSEYSNPSSEYDLYSVRWSTEDRTTR